ncbi:MAG: hypothetical protein IT458_12660 [Planctomycetes bacterium]|nr:hypothetical protein [Planctomycetota bacterium]
MPPLRETVEGASSSTAYAPWYGSSGQGRYQWISGENKGTPIPAIKKFEMRRDGLAATSTGYAARTTDMEVVMAHADYATLTTTYANNYKNAQSTVVFTRKPVSLPNHGPNVGSPAPWSIAVQYDTPFAYNGTDSLLFEVSCQNTTPTGTYSLDCEPGLAPGGTGAYVDTAGQCTTPNGGFDIFLGSPSIALTPTTVTIRPYGTGGPSSQPGVLGLGLVDLNSNFGGVLCAKLRTSMDVLIPVNTTATGAIGSSSAPILLTFPNPGVNATLYGQFAVLDPSQTSPFVPVALSDAVRYTIVPNGVQLRTIWNDTSATAATGTLSFSGFSVVRFTY